MAAKAQFGCDVAGRSPTGLHSSANADVEVRMAPGARKARPSPPPGAPEGRPTHRQNENNPRYGVRGGNAVGTRHGDKATMAPWPASGQVPTATAALPGRPPETAHRGLIVGEGRAARVGAAQQQAPPLHLTPRPMKEARPACGACNGRGKLSPPQDGQQLTTATSSSCRERRKAATDHAPAAQDEVADGHPASRVT